MCHSSVAGRERAVYSSIKSRWERVMFHPTLARPKKQACPCIPFGQERAVCCSVRAGQERAVCHPSVPCWDTAVCLSIKTSLRGLFMVPSKWARRGRCVAPFHPLVRGLSVVLFRLASQGLCQYIQKRSEEKLMK